MRVLGCFVGAKGSPIGGGRFPIMSHTPPQRSLLFVSVLLLLASCVVPAPSPERSGTPERIVTLNGAMTEVVAALGLGDRIVGVDVTSTYPPAMTGVPKVGHDRTVRAEGVLSLQPDLVIGDDTQLDATVRGQLARAGVHVVLLRNDFSVEGTKRIIRQLADTLGATQKADSVIASIDAAMQAVQPLPDTPSVLFIYARGAGALMAAGRGTPMERMIQLAGGRNAVTGFEQFKPLTPEALIAADPDAVLLFDSGMEALQGVEGLMQVPGMAATKAGRAGAFIAMDGGFLSNFGPRVGEAAARLNSALRERPLAP
jgi:iron complex transport system substrate-binding protein